MKTSILARNFFIAACLPWFASCAERQAFHYSHPPAEVFIADNAPPPPTPLPEVITVAPGKLDPWQWIPGCWEWRGHWIWMGGHWVIRPNPGAEWVAPHFGYRGRYRVWFGGCWR